MSAENERSWRSVVVVRGRAAGISTRILSEVVGVPTSISEVEFTIQDTLVNVRSKDGAFLVSEEDEIVAVGSFSDGKVKAIAWWNIATQKGRRPSDRYFLPALFVAVVSGAAFLGRLTTLSSMARRADIVAWGVLALVAVLFTISEFHQRRARQLLDLNLAPEKRRKAQR